jgi:uncharacterized SAM-binding protein YcdF (DUF218 family)
VLDNENQAVDKSDSCKVFARRRLVRRWAVRFLLLIGLLFFLLFAGRALVADHPEKSDVIVVLAGDSIDQRYRHGMELLRAGYGKHLFLDASSDSSYFGHTPVEYATAFLKEDAHEMERFVSVCPYEENSTITETLYVAKCLEQFHPQRVLLVTSDWHTARALSIFAHRLPKYRWSAAGARDHRLFGPLWWQHREWAKTTFHEWLKVVWWNMVDRWR